jgi:hypothetical protein
MWSAAAVVVEAEFAIPVLENELKAEVSELPAHGAAVIEDVRPPLGKLTVATAWPLEVGPEGTPLTLTVSK